MKHPVSPLILLSVFLFLIVLPFGLNSSISGSSATGEETSLRIQASGYEEISGSVRFDEPVVVEIETTEGPFSGLRVANTTETREIGRPELPVLRRLFQIPMGAEPSIVLSSVEGRTVTSRSIGVTYPFFPVQPPLPKAADTQEPIEFAVDRETYATDRFYPEEIARITDTGIIRGHAYAVVEFYPIRYNPVRGEFWLLSTADFRIQLRGSDPLATEADLARYTAHPVEKILADILVNHGDFHPSERLVLPPPLGLLIIVPDAYYSDALAYADWKVQKGLYTTVAPLSETGSTRDEIYDYIDNAYHTWEVPPTYVLLFGDTNLIPHYTGSTGGHATDLKYATVDGGDWLPDLIVGRLPFRTRTQLVTMLGKAYDYETLSLPGLDFLNETCFIASNDPTFWDLAEDTHRYVIRHYIRPNGIDYTAIRGHSGGNTQDITDAVNAGQIFVNYSGHGSTTSWGGPQFSQSNIRSLTNQDMYPLVISHACLTGSYALDECFGETWLRESNKGGLAFWGASNSTYWYEDDFLERRMYDANFLRGFTTIGEQTYAALYWMYSDGWSLDQYYFEVYNILGDPTVDIYMGYPFAADVSYPQTVPIGPQEFTIEVMDGGAGVNHALVCVMKEGEVYETGFTGDDGAVTLWIEPASAGAMGVTVTAHNMTPHEGEVTIGASRK